MRFESQSHGLGLAGESGRTLRKSQSPGEQRSVSFGAVYVRLNLAKGDRPFRKPAIMMENRVEGILPSLIREALLGLAMIFDETVAIAVAVMIDPGKRCLGVRPQRAHRLEIAGAPEILPEQQQEEGRGVDAPVVAAKRHLAQICHFPMAHFVQNLSRLGVTFRLDRGRLRGGEKSEHAARNGGVEPQSHQRGDDSVAPERGAEPGNSGVRVGPLRRIGNEHVQIRNGAPDNFVVYGI